MDDSHRLFAIKAFHTLVWAFFAGCIVAIPLAVWLGNLRAAFILIAIMLVEVAVILLNRGSCPLTGVAARYTADRADNFDIFLPVWLARYNKVLFGGLFVLALAYTLFTWAGLRGSA